jgi:hypothetical protein
MRRPDVGKPEKGRQGREEGNNLRSAPVRYDAAEPPVSPPIF